MVGETNSVTQIRRSGSKTRSGCSAKVVTNGMSVAPPVLPVTVTVPGTVAAVPTSRARTVIDTGTPNGTWAGWAVVVIVRRKVSWSGTLTWPTTSSNHTLVPWISLPDDVQHVCIIVSSVAVGFQRYSMLPSPTARNWLKSMVPRCTAWAG